jgi:Putative MetA-pathway of phenol degradation
MPLSSDIRHGFPFGLVILSACATMRPVDSPMPVIEADRPDFTESTETVPPGTIQAEGGYTLSRDEATTTHSIGELLVRVPASRHAEVRVGFNSYSIERTAGVVRRGFEDMDIGAKVRLIEREERSLIPSVSILGLTTLPTGHRGIGSSVMQPTAKLALSWGLSERLSLESNANYTYASENGTRFSQWAGSASFGAEISPRIESFAEWFGTSPASLGASRADYLDAGAAIRFGTSLKLDARAGVNARVSRDYFVGFGISHRW